MSKDTNKNFTDSNFFYFMVGLGLGILVLLAISFYSSSKKTNDNNSGPKEKSEETSQPVSSAPQDYKIITPVIPDSLYFAGEKVPLKNFEVKERIEREFIVNTYWHSYTILALKRSNRWFSVIEPILRKYNVPDDFKYVCVIESNLENVTSPAKAVGFWQITKGAAKKYGLEVNKEIDERYNVIKSTEAACRYFNDAYSEFNSWTLAAASYNMGINGVDKQIERQKQKNYYNLLLNTETARYMARVIAMKTILNNPHRYGFYIKKSELYKPLDVKTIIVSHSIKNLADYADEKGINYKILKYYNPWLRDISLPDRSGKAYAIVLPKKGAEEIVND